MIGIARRPLGRGTAAPRFTVRCDADRWEFDPRYTEGRCPICGSAIDIAPAAPRWLLLSRRVPWDMVFLFALLLAMVVLSFVVVRANGMLPAGAFHGWPASVRHLLGG